MKNFLKSTKGAGEMAQGLKALTTVLEDLSSIDSTHRTAYNCL